jgi:HlyD family secretion protein
MATDLDSLRIDKDKTATGGSRWASRWIVGGVLVFLLLGAARFVGRNSPSRPKCKRSKLSPADPAGVRVILNATGYIVAHHKIQLASKVVGKVAWIGVEKGDKVTQGQVIVRLEDDEYRAQLQQAQGQLAALEARLKELRNGSRPEEIAVAKANLDSARADLANARINLDRTRKLVEEKVLSIQALDDHKSRYDMHENRIHSLERTYELQCASDRAPGDPADAGRNHPRPRFRRVRRNAACQHCHPRHQRNHPRPQRRARRNFTTGFVGDRGTKASSFGRPERPAGGARHQSERFRASTQTKRSSPPTPIDRKYDGVIDKSRRSQPRQGHRAGEGEGARPTYASE